MLLQGLEVICWFSWSYIKQSSENVWSLFRDVSSGVFDPSLTLSVSVDHTSFAMGNHNSSLMTCYHWGEKHDGRLCLCVGAYISWCWQMYVYSCLVHSKCLKAEYYDVGQHSLYRVTVVQKWTLSETDKYEIWCKNVFQVRSKTGVGFSLFFFFFFGENLSGFHFASALCLFTVTTRVITSVHMICINVSSIQGTWCFWN